MQVNKKYLYVLFYIMDKFKWTPKKRQAAYLMIETQVAIRFNQFLR